MVAQTPNFAPAYKELATFLEDDTDALKTIEIGLSLKPDAETSGFLLVNKALIWNRMGKHEQAIQILGDLILSPTTPQDVVQIAKATLTDITN